jgi:hypothetical protein
MNRHMIVAALCALTLAGCASKRSDEAQIRDTVRTFARALGDGQTQRYAACLRRTPGLRSSRPNLDTDVRLTDCRSLLTMARRTLEDSALSSIRRMDVETVTFTRDRAVANLTSRPPIRRPTASGHGRSMADDSWSCEMRLPGGAR